MSTRMGRELDGVPHDLLRRWGKKYFHRASENARREWAWNWNLEQKRRAHIQRKTSEHQARVEAEWGTGDQRRQRFYSAFEASPVRLPSTSLSLSVGG